MTVSDITDGLMTAEQTAAVLRVSIRTLRRYKREADGLPFIRIGKRDLFRPQSVADWVARRERQMNPRAKRRRAA